MKSIFLILASVLFFVNTTFAQDSQVVRQKHFNLTKGVAIQGYDPVAYFTQNKAVKGKKEITHTIQGVTYQFSSQANKDLFVKNHAKYEPQYGGWCAYACGANNSKVSIDPGTFKIVNGKLYLFYNAYFTNTLTSWNKDESNLKSKADTYWNKTAK